jgi:WD40 repeat protein
VWSSESGAHLHTMVGHTCFVLALAVGLDGKVYSGSNDRTVRVWSGDDSTHLQTLVGHAGQVRTLAIGKDGIIYSGSLDRTIRGWSGEDGTHLRTLLGLTHDIASLVVGLDGTVSIRGRKTIQSGRGPQTTVHSCGPCIETTATILAISGHSLWSQVACCFLDWMMAPS